MRQIWKTHILIFFYHIHFVHFDLMCDIEIRKWTDIYFICMELIIMH